MWDNKNCKCIKKCDIVLSCWYPYYTWNENICGCQPKNLNDAVQYCDLD